MEKAVEVSNKIWDAIQKENVDVLEELVHQDAVFVQYGNYAIT